MTTLSLWIELLGRGNPSSYRKCLERPTETPILFMNIQGSVRTCIVTRCLCHHQKLKPFRS